MYGTKHNSTHPNKQAKKKTTTGIPQAPGVLPDIPVPIPSPSRNCGTHVLLFTCYWLTSLCASETLCENLLKRKVSVVGRAQTQKDQVLNPSPAGYLPELRPPLGLSAVCMRKCKHPHSPGLSSGLKSQTPRLFNKFTETSWELSPLETGDESNPVFTLKKLTVWKHVTTKTSQPVSALKQGGK